MNRQSDFVTEARHAARIQDFIDVSLGDGWAFKNHDEANIVLSAIANLQVRAGELEARFNTATGINLIA